MTEQEFTLGFSPCPNDTFMFHALVSGAVKVSEQRYRPWLQDIEKLNRRAMDEAPLPFTKLSVAAYAQVASNYRLLDAGAALGRGCGPLVVVRSDSPYRSLSDLAGRSVAIPGHGTTAWLLLRVLGGATLLPREMRFEQIMSAVGAGTVDAGLVIHESRFTFPEFGLRAVLDLGEAWEAKTALPLPLGLIAARRDLPNSVVENFETGLRSSVQRAFAEPALSANYVAQHAQEMDPQVTRSHIELYVNQFSVSLGEEGRSAVQALLSHGHACGALPLIDDLWARG